jgi:cytoskeletal protein RodZ
LTQPPVPPEQPGEFSDFFHTDELPTGPVPRKSHRGDRARLPVSQRVLAPLTAVVVVVVVILLLIWINGKPSGKGPGPGVISAPNSTAAVVPSSIAPTLTKAPIHQRPLPSHRATASPSVSPTPSPSATAKATAKPGSALDRTAMAPVQVLNNSTISGLAARVAAEVHAKSWKISSVGNLQGSLAVTTVFYAPGELAAAKHLKREFASIRAVAPDASAHISSHGDLTLVVTKDWSG